VQVEGVAELGVGVVEAAQPDIGESEVAVGVSLCRLVGQPPGGGHCGALDGGVVVPVPPPVEEGPQGPGQLPGVGVEAGGGGVVDGGQQHGTLRGEPGHGLPMVGEVFGGDPRLGGIEGERVLGRGQQPVGGVGGVQVVVKEAVGGAAALLVGIGGVGQVGGVGTQQVMEGVPAGGVLGEQAGPGQL